MAKRPHYINPFSMGLLGGITDWAKSMEKYNLLEQQNEARQKAYETKYKMMGENFVNEQRARNNALLQKMTLEIPQKQHEVYSQDADGNTIVSLVRKIPDPQDPTHFIDHVEWTGSVEKYNKEFGKNKSAASGYTLSPGQVRYDAQGNVIAKAAEKPDAQAAILARQQTMETQRAKDAMAREDAKELKSNLQKAQSATDADMKEFRKAEPAEQKQMLADAGVDPEAPNAEASYRRFKLADHQKELGVGDAPGAVFGPKEGESTAPSVGRDTTEAAPTAKSEPTIIHGKDGKAYQLPDGIDPATGQPKTYLKGTDPETGQPMYGVHAIPLAMDTVDTGDTVAQAGGEEAAETAPDNESAEPEDPYSGLLDQYAKSSDAGLAQVQNQMASDQDQEIEPAPQDEENSLLAG